MKRLLISFTLLTHCCFVWSQIGGNNTFEFLNLPASARITALSNSNIAHISSDVNNASLNPSLYNIDTDNTLAFNTLFYVADILNTNTAFSKNIKNFATVGASIQYVNYGKFAATNTSGIITGQFSANEYAIIFGGAKQHGNWHYGLNTKFIGSTLESYKSLGIAADLGLTYYSINKEFGAALVVKNIGTQLKTYTINNQESLPFEIQFGISKKLKYLPFRINVLAHNLQTFDIRYNDTLQNSSTFLNNNASKNNGNHIFDKLMRHINIGGELYLGKNKNVQLQLGYSYLRNQELKIKEARSLAGVSFGLGIKISRFEISYGRGNYYIGIASNHLSISTNLNRWKKPAPEKIIDKTEP